MKRLVYGICFLTVVLSCVRCTSPQMQMDQHWKAYKVAMTNGDIGTAIVEVNSILALDTSSQSVLDTIMRLYFVRGNYISAYNVGNQIDEKSSIHKSILAESSLQLGLTEEAKNLLLDIEENDSAGLNIGSRYKLATILYNEKAYAETLALLGKIVDDEKSLDQLTRIGGDNEVVQNVSLYAASHNFAGFVFMELGEYNSAESHFNEALRIQPDFKLVQNNLEQLAGLVAAAP